MSHLYAEREVSTMVYLDVPVLPQTHSMACWHAAARMLYAYRGISIDPLPDLHRLGLNASGIGGLAGRRFDELAMDIGLRKLPVPIMSIHPDSLSRWIRSYGPLWAAGRWDGLPHIIVVVGVGIGDPNNVVINDPARGKGRRVETMEWFNARLTRSLPAPILYLRHKPKIHIVKKGDWLSKLAERYYGNADLYHPIYWANPSVIGKNEDLIRPGQLLIIPPKQ
jgi:nucleoid-associated protein YgaU